jgi:hypothetical protein
MEHCVRCSGFSGGRQFCASKSPPSGSGKTLAGIVKDDQVKNVLLKDMIKTEIAKAFSNGEFENKQIHC